MAGWNSHMKYSSVFAYNEHARFIDFRIIHLKSIIDLPKRSENLWEQYNFRLGLGVDVIYTFDDKGHRMVAWMTRLNTLIPQLAALMILNCPNKICS